MYNHRAKLYCSSRVPIEELFAMNGSETSEEMFMVHRCLSRIKEMQTKKYLSEKHLDTPFHLVHS